MIATEGAVYCHDCAVHLFISEDTIYAERELVLQYPALHDEDEEKFLFSMDDICQGCGKEVDLRKASKVIRMEIRA